MRVELTPTEGVPFVNASLPSVANWSPKSNAPVSGIGVSSTRSVVTSGDSELRLVDISNPAAPVALGTWSTFLPLSDTALSGNLAYIASWEADFLSTIEVVDFTDPAKPVLRGYFDTPGYAQELLLRGSILYVADAEGGLLIVDVGDPANPRRIGGYETKGLVEHVEVYGRHAYIPDGKWLVVLDVSDPANPRRAGMYEVAEGCSSLKAYGTSLYVSVANGGLLLLDVAHPAQIQTLGTYRAWGSPAQAMAVSGQYLYLAKGNGGLHVLDVSDPAKPVYVTSAWTPPAHDVALLGKNVLVAAGDKGLVISELQKRLYPPLPNPVVSGGNMTLTWAATDDVRLQRTTNLLNAVWLDVPESEGTNTLTLTLTEPMSFFRLVQGPKVGQAIPAPPGMVAWWSGDGNALDALGIYDGAAMNDTTFVAGKVGLAFSLDGDYDYIALPFTNALYNPVTGFTWDAWVRPTRLTEASIMIASDSGDPSDYQIGIGGPGRHNPVGGQVWAPVGWNFLTATPPEGLDAGLWYHVALVVDVPRRRIELYANGQLIHSTDVNGALNDRNMWVTIGAERDTPDVWPDEQFEGLIDEFHVFNRPLTADEIKAIYDAGSAGIVKPSR